MPEFEPQKLAEWSEGVWSNLPEGAIRGFCFDARQVKEGDCFVALSGGARDGHDFLEQAAQGGAIAALVENKSALELPQLQVADSLCAMGAIATAIRESFKKPVVAITGSCGKTSTKEMLRCLLGATQTHATAGNWNNRIGVPMTLFDLDSTSHEFAVIEAGINQPKEMAALGHMIRADVNILTNVGDAHLELLGSREHIAAEKSLLAQYAAEDSPIILTAETLRYPAYAALADRAIVLCSEDESAPDLQVRAVVSYSLQANESQGHTLQIGGMTHAIASYSRGIGTNAALAIVAAQELGISPDDIRERIERWRPGGDRGRIAELGAQLFYIDCYNANPSSMADAMDAFLLGTDPEHPRFLILGAMNELGDCAYDRHRQIGQRLSLRAKDQVAFVGPPELTEAYEAGALAADIDPAQMCSTESVRNLKSIVATFNGAIFLKGSRGYRLEALLPESLRT